MKNAIFLLVVLAMFSCSVYGYGDNASKSTGKDDGLGMLVYDINNCQTAQNMSFYTALGGAALFSVGLFGDSLVTGGDPAQNAKGLAWCKVIGLAAAIPAILVYWSSSNQLTELKSRQYEIQSEKNRVSGINTNIFFTPENNGMAFNVLFSTAI